MIVRSFYDTLSYMKSPVKMIVSDLDGTLLRSEKFISEYTKRILSRCREAGIKTVYATARGASAAVLAPSELFDGEITMNGAVARVGDEVVYKRLIPCLTARPILLACAERGMKSSTEYGGTFYSNFNAAELWPHMSYSKTVDLSIHDKDAEKLSILVQNDDEADFIESLLPEELYMNVSSDGLAMVMHKEAAKSKAAAALARMWGIEQAEIAAFGDELNDIDMLSYAGTGVAMANALCEVKAIAGCTCMSNDEDGVAAWLEENVL